MSDIRGLVIPKKTKASLNSILIDNGFNIAIQQNDVIRIYSYLNKVVNFIDTTYNLNSLPEKTVWSVFNNLRDYKVLNNIYIENKSEEDVVLDIVIFTDSSSSDQQAVVDSLDGIKDAILTNKDIEINIVRDSDTPPKDFIQILTLDYSTNPPTPNAPIYKTMDFQTPANPPVGQINRVSDTIYTFKKDTVIANATVVGKYTINDELTRVTFYYGKVRQESIWYNETTNSLIAGIVPRTDYIYTSQLSTSIDNLIDISENWSNEFIIVKKAKIYTVLSSWNISLNINDIVAKITVYTNGVKTEQWVKITDNTKDILSNDPSIISIPTPPLSSNVLEDENYIDKTIYKLENRKNENNTLEQEKEYLYHNSLNVFGLYKGSTVWVNV